MSYPLSNSLKNCTEYENDVLTQICVRLFIYEGTIQCEYYMRHFGIYIPIVNTKTYSDLRVNFFLFIYYQPIL